MVIDKVEISNSKASSQNFSTVASVRGSVVDIRFEKRLPPMLDAHRVRGIALTPTQGLARGMVVEDSGGPLQVPVGKAILSRMFDVFGNVIDRQPAPSDVQWRSIHRAPPPLARRI